MSSETVLQASGLIRNFGQRQAVAGVDLEVSRGEVLGLLGLNGAGKSTTLQMLCGVLAPSAGAVTVNGVDLLDRPRAAKQHLGYLPETPVLQPDSRVRDYLVWCARLRRVAAGSRSAAVDYAMERCGLTEVAGRVVRNLSKGYQQRVGIAQAIVHEPSLIVLDEPTVGLDPRQVQAIRALIDDLREGHGVIFSSHILSEVQAVSDRVTILHHGRAIYSGHAEAADRGDGRYRVRFAQPPSSEALLAVDGISHVEPAADDGVLLTLTGEDALDALIATATREHWQLRELGPERRSLERAFLELTQTHTEDAA